LTIKLDIKKQLKYVVITNLYENEDMLILQRKISMWGKPILLVLQITSCYY